MHSLIRRLGAVVLIGAVLSSPAWGAVTLDDLLNAVKGNDVGAARDLLARGMDPSSTDREGYSLLMYSAREGNLQMMELLLDKGAKFNARNFAGETAIMLAAYKGNLESVKLLSRRGAQIDQNGWAAMHYAAIEGRTEVLRFLLDQGGNVDARAPNGATPLMLASKSGHLAGVQLLLDRGADPKLQTDSQADALTWADQAGHSQIASLLRARIGK